MMKKLKLLGLVGLMIVFSSCLDAPMGYVRYSAKIFEYSGIYDPILYPNGKKIIYKTKLKYRFDKAEDSKKVIKDLDTGKLSLSEYNNVIDFFPDGDALINENRNLYKKNLLNNTQIKLNFKVPFIIESISFSEDGTFFAFLDISKYNERDNLNVFDISKNSLVKSIDLTDTLFNEYYNGWSKGNSFTFDVNFRPVLSKNGEKIFFIDSSNPKDFFSNKLYTIYLENNKLNKRIFESDLGKVSLLYIEGKEDKAFYTITDKDNKKHYYTENLDDKNITEIKNDSFNPIRIISINKKKIFYQEESPNNIVYYFIDIDGSNKTQVLDSNEQRDPKNFTKNETIYFTIKE